MRRRVAVALVGVAVVAGCGFGPGPTRGGAGAQLRVTRDFGRKLLLTGRVAKVRTSDTVMRLLASKAKITTRYGGRFVQSIDGLAGTSSGPRDWFYFVNGTEAPTGAAARKLAAGDVVQWDYRDWQATAHVPAIVGAFPEPFLHGQEGTHYPTRVECASGATKACDVVTTALSNAGVPAGTGAVGAEARGGVFRIEVGPWRAVAALGELAPLLRGPRASGIYARFAGPATLQLLDESGRVVRTAPPGSGLVAALIPPGQQPLWVVTGVDEAGVARAAGLLGSPALRNAYAVAALPPGPVRLPVQAAR
jgi:Domain of unknown function (DUF4430)